MSVTTLFDDDLVARATTLVHQFSAQNLTVATAESCTGGLLAGLLTEVPGSSAVLDRGFVTYSNAAKQDLLGVPAALIAAHGAVSAPVAMAMAEGALRKAGTRIAIAITGIAGPGGGSPEKPVGLVHFACASAAGTSSHHEFFGDLGRSAVRRTAIVTALQMLETRAR